MKKRVRLDTKDPKDIKEAKSGKEGKDQKREEKVQDTGALEDDDENEGFGEWLSTSVWKMIDVYFKNQFESYLRAEYDKNPHMLADIKAYRTAAGKEGPAAPILEEEEHSNNVVRTCLADVQRVSDEDDLKISRVISVNTEENFIESTSSTVEFEIAKAADGESDRVINENEISKVKSPGAIDRQLKSDSSEKGNDKKKRTTRPTPTGKVKEEKTAKKKLKTILLTEKDFQSTRIKVTPQDFAEFDVDEDRVQNPEDEPDSILVSDLPFKPKADIGDLQRVSPQEFCPLKLEDEFSCDETKAWSW